MSNILLPCDFTLSIGVATMEIPRSRSK